MALAFPATATTARDSASSTHVANLPSGISSGDLLVVAYLDNDTGRYLVTPGDWDGEYHTNDGVSIGTIGFVYKEADGTEGATEAFSYNTGTSITASVAFRVTGHDSADPFNTSNYVADNETSEDPWTVASGLLSGIANSDSNIVLIGGAKAVRSIATQDSGQTLITSVNDGFSIHALRELSPGSSNSAYSNDMSDARAWLEILLEIKAAAAGGTTHEVATAFGLSVATTHNPAAVLLGSITSALTAGQTAASAAVFEAAAQFAASAGVAHAADASLQASVSHGLTVTHSLVGGQAIVASMAHGLQAGHSVVADISIEAAAGFGVSAGQGLTAQADFNAALSVSQQVGVNVVTTAVLAAGFSVAAITSLSIVGSLVSANVTTPVGRTLRVTAELRTLAVPHEDRTLAVEPSTRTLKIH